MFTLQLAQLESDKIQIDAEFSMKVWGIPRGIDPSRYESGHLPKTSFF